MLHNKVQEFYAFPINLNMLSANRILLNPTELSCDFLFSICLLLSLCSLLLLSCLLLGRIFSDSLWLDRSANFCLMLLTFFLFCGFIIEPAIHSHNLCVKKKMDNDIGDYQVFMLYMPKVEGVDNEERMWKHSPKSKAACQVRLLLLPNCAPSHNFFSKLYG